jgi:hypothetical protein
MTAVDLNVTQQSWIHCWAARNSIATVGHKTHRHVITVSSPFHSTCELWDIVIFLEKYIGRSGKLLLGPRQHSYSWFRAPSGLMIIFLFHWSGISLQKTPLFQLLFPIADVTEDSQRCDETYSVLLPLYGCQGC